MSKGYSYNKEKLKQRQGRAIYGLIGQQLGGLGGVVAGGTKGGTAGILGNYALGSVAGLGAGYLAGAHLPVGGNRQLDYTVERAIKHYRKTGKKNATFRDLERNYNLKLSKQAALENFLMVKESSKTYYNSNTGKFRVPSREEWKAMSPLERQAFNLADEAHARDMEDLLGSRPLRDRTSASVKPPPTKLAPKLQVPPTVKLNPRQQEAIDDLNRTLDAIRDRQARRSAKLKHEIAKSRARMEAHLNSSPGFPPPRRGGASRGMSTLGKVGLGAAALATIYGTKKYLDSRRR